MKINQLLISLLIGYALINWKTVEANPVLLSQNLQAYKIDAGRQMGTFGLSINPHPQSNQYPVISFIPNKSIVYIQDRNDNLKHRTYARRDEIDLLPKYLYGITESGVQIQILNNHVSVRPDLSHPFKEPKYKINRIGIKTIKTSCSNPIHDLGDFPIDTPSSPLPDPDINAIKHVLRVFDLGYMLEDGRRRIFIESQFGQENRRILFRLYEVQKRDGGKFNLAAKITEFCQNGKPDTIEEVVLRNDHIRYPLIASRSDRKLKRYTTSSGTFNGYSYLYSINNFAQYTNLINYLNKLRPNPLIENLLVDYFLSEFNRSCWSQHRLKPESECNRHKYTANEFSSE